VIALLRDRALARRMGEEGRAIVEREFGVEAMRRQYEALYTEVLEEGRRRARWAA
jgi:L-malate glycosyltransferase